MTKEQIYERMTVQLVHPDPEIPCEFDDGKPCDKLYGEVSAARLRLCKRMGMEDLCAENVRLRRTVRRLKRAPRREIISLRGAAVCLEAQSPSSHLEGSLSTGRWYRFAG